MADGDLAALTLRTAQELLENDELAADDNFFAAGGDSMLAMHLVGRLSRACGQRLRVSLLLEHPVLSDFVAAIGIQGSVDAR